MVKGWCMEHVTGSMVIEFHCCPLHYQITVILKHISSLNLYAKTPLEDLSLQARGQSKPCFAYIQLSAKQVWEQQGTVSAPHNQWSVQWYWYGIEPPWTFLLEWVALCMFVALFGDKLHTIFKGAVCRDCYATIAAESHHILGAIKG